MNSKLRLIGINLNEIDSEANVYWNRNLKNYYYRNLMKVVVYVIWVNAYRVLVRKWKISAFRPKWLSFTLENDFKYNGIIVVQIIVITI